ncbi:hypothetical protein ABER98_17030 [Domibacillus aminovorans]|uniref:Uncharacterized protein n=1 Tax=Domibacillus aminovorans TaxID=29332 RepID=A0A177KXX8_9BACI|nr:MULTISPECIES: hypothetical protein [Bacillaceae]OAH57996.1 hypothetical protein AWH48_03040 [Domibacillus aminovorans]
MKIKVIMDSGKEYEVTHESATVQDFINSLYQEMPNGMTMMMSGFLAVDEGQKELFNPMHISSIEVID